MAVRAQKIGQIKMERPPNMRAAPAKAALTGGTAHPTIQQRAPQLKCRQQVHQQVPLRYQLSLHLPKRRTIISNVPLKAPLPTTVRQSFTFQLKEFCGTSKSSLKMANTSYLLAKLWAVVNQY